MPFALTLSLAVEIEPVLAISKCSQWLLIWGVNVKDYLVLLRFFQVRLDRAHSAISAGSNLQVLFLGPSVTKIAGIVPSAAQT